MGVSAEICNIVMQVGSCIAFIIYFNTFIHHAFCSYQVESICGNTGFNVALVILVVCPLMFITSMHFLSYANLVAVCCTLWGLLALIIFDFEKMANQDGDWAAFVSGLGTFKIRDLPAFFGVAIYAFEGIGVAFSVRNSMEKPSEFFDLLKKLCMFCFLLYSSISAVSGVAFRSDIKEIAIFGLPANHFYYFSAQVLFAFSVILALPSQIYPGLEIIEEKVNRKYKLFDSEGNTINKPLRFGIRILLFICMVLVAFLNKSFYYFIALLGCLAFNYLGIIYPIMIYQKYFKGKLKWWRSGINYLMLAIGIFFGVFGVVDSL
mmetsp:Transcript_15164/g.12911  ORF Transcript_15164/g.12911 Transcript_15164/m.12911 type:complete len:320 (-) Transcript_15164:56-1015(-)